MLRALIQAVERLQRRFNPAAYKKAAKAQANALAKHPPKRKRRR